MQVWFKCDYFGVLIQNGVRMQFLVCLVALDADVNAITEADKSTLVFWLVVRFVEAKAYFQVTRSVCAVGMQVNLIW